MKLIPIRDRIVVQLIEAETTTASGLIIPDAAAEKPSQGDVLAVGTGRIAEAGELVPMVEVRSIWINGGRFGAMWEVTDLRVNAVVARSPWAY